MDIKTIKQNRKIIKVKHIYGVSRGDSFGVGVGVLLIPPFLPLFLRKEL